MPEFVSQLFRDLSAQRLRTFLTLLGITWGTVAVVVLMAFGVGFEKQTRANMAGMGDGIVVVFGGRTTKPFMGFNDGRGIGLREADVEVIQQQIPGIASISPEYRTSSAVARVDTSSTIPATTGVYPEYADMRNIIPEPGGRFLNELDERNRRRVVVLGDQVKRLLFGAEEALHKQIILGGTPFTVIGVMAPKTQSSSYGSRDTDRVFIPASTFESVFGHRYLSNIIYKPIDASNSPAIEAKLYEVMGSRYRFDPTDKDALGVWDTNELTRLLDGIFIGIAVFMMVVGAFTLVVGGVGVANIMYIVVKERTREIGIKRSLGARRRTILAQFLGEAGFIVLMGAALGMVISAALVKGASFLPVQDAVGAPEMSAGVLIGTALLLGLIALLAGFFPARRAAAVSPVEALRYGV